MAIDWGTIALGTVIGVGCHQQIKAATRVAATAAASIADATAEAIAKASRSPEEEAAEAWTKKMDQQLGQNSNGN